MAVTILETLSREDLLRYRNSAATLELAESYGHGLSGEEIRQAFLDQWDLMEELFDAYGLSNEESAEAKISLYTGHIVLGAEN